MRQLNKRKLSAAALLGLALVLQSCGSKDSKVQPSVAAEEIKVEEVKPDVKVEIEDTGKIIAEGKEIFRHETFGNESFWTETAQLPQGLAKSKLTPAQALKLGLSINAEALDTELQKAISKELFKEGLSGKILNSHETTMKILNANAFIGLVVKDTNGDSKKDLRSGDQMGVSCVLCHSVTDKSIFDMPGGGSIGRPVDGPSVHRLNLGAIMAMADNTRAFFPMAQLKDEEGNSIGRAPSEKGLTKDSTEGEFDAYFSNTTYYPVGTFDDTLDGIGNPMRNGAAYRADLAAPYGSAGEFEKFNQYANHYYSTVLNPTNILTKESRQFMERISGSLGVRIAEDYAEILQKSGSQNIAPKSSSAPEEKLSSLKKYLDQLRSPRGVVFEKSSVTKGEELFKGAKYGCTSCHNIDQSKPVLKEIVAMNVIFKGDNPVVVRKRDNLIHPLQDTAGTTYDDKMIVMNATMRGLNRGVAMPLLMDLAKKTAYLHDSSVSTLTKLLDPARGDSAPHAYYVGSAEERSDMVAFLKNLDDNNGK